MNRTVNDAGPIGPNYQMLAVARTKERYDATDADPDRCSRRAGRGRSSRGRQCASGSVRHEVSPQLLAGRLRRRKQVRLRVEGAPVIRLQGEPKLRAEPEAEVHHGSRPETEDPARPRGVQD